MLLILHIPFPLKVKSVCLWYSSYSFYGIARSFNFYFISIFRFFIVTSAKVPCSSSLFIGIKLQVMFSNIKELIVSFFKKKMMITCKLLLTCIKFLNIAREDGEKYVIWQDLKKKNALRPNIWWFFESKLLWAFWSRVLYKTFWLDNKTDQSIFDSLCQSEQKNCLLLKLRKMFSDSYVILRHNAVKYLKL